MNTDWYNNFNYSSTHWGSYEQQKKDTTNYTDIDYKEHIEYEDDVMDADYEFTSIDGDDDYDIDTQAGYPAVPDFDLWEGYLKRKLKKKEYEIIHDYLLENDTNLQIKSLHYNTILSGAFTIPKLTKNNGNCLFESLSHLGYGKPSEIRKNIAALLLLVRYNNDFFPKRDVCPEELFNNCNYEDLVKDGITNIVYEYDYDTMIVDLYRNHSWTRLPMQLILMTISRIYEVHIKIFSNKSDYVNVITVWESDEPDIDTVYLGHINEEHYIPVIKISEDITRDAFLMEEFRKNYPRYISAKKKYHQWAKRVSLTIESYYDSFSNYNGYGFDNGRYNNGHNSRYGSPNNTQYWTRESQQRTSYNTPYGTRQTSSNTRSDTYLDVEQFEDLDDFEVVK
jgi:hypothetical protein